MSIKEQAKRFWKVFVMEKQNLEKALLENDQDEIKEINTNGHCGVVRHNRRCFLY